MRAWSYRMIRGRRSPRCGPWVAADAERHIESQRTGGNHLDVLLGLVAQSHCGTFAKALLDLRQRGVQRRLALGIELVLVLGCRVLGRLGLKCHDLLLVEVVCESDASTV